MSSDALFVLAGLPFGVQTAVGTENVARLPEAHPLAKVEVVAEDAAFSALLREADGVILFPNFAPLLAPVLGPDTRLRWVHSVAAGVNRVLIPELMAARQVVVTSSKGPMGPLMAEHCVLLMLALARDLPGYFQDQAERRWRHLADERPMIDLLGRTVAILGVGAVGGNLARMCKVGFGMRVLGLSRTRRDDPHVDRYYDRADLHAMLAQADFVVLTPAIRPSRKASISAGSSTSPPRATFTR